MCSSIDLSSESEDKEVHKTGCVCYHIGRCFVIFTLPSSSDEDDDDNASLPPTPSVNRYVFIRGLSKTFTHFTRVVVANDLPLLVLRE
jgi:hypothetical protein